MPLKVNSGRVKHYLALRCHWIGGFGTLLAKNLRKSPQFFDELEEQS